MSTLNIDTEKTLEKVSFTTALLCTKKKKGIEFSLEVYYYIVFCFKLTLNNIHFILSSLDKKPFYNISAGKLRYRNSQKTTPMTTRAISVKILELFEIFGSCFIHLKLKGFGQRLKIFLREINSITKKKANPFHILWIEKSLAIPLNGCRFSKRK